ncbi:MAG: hypothetical protein FJ388_16875, partial [Verrucomicrobia bacterium]|nr:hypothetical protein [Verrucomicrobiota bacterium]
MAVAGAQSSTPLTFLKLTFGIGDTAGRDWSGSVRVESGTIADIQPCGFETRHTLNTNEHSWVCDSEVKVARGKTRFAEPQRGIVLGVQGPPSARVAVDTKQGAFACLLSELRTGKITPMLNGAASVELVMAPRQAAATEAEEDYPAIAVDADNRAWVAWVSWENGADVIYARSFDGKATALAGPGDFYQVKLGCDGRGRLWAVWAAQENGNWDLFARVRERGEWGAVRRLTDAPGSDFKQVLATDSNGNLWLAWQSFRERNSDIGLRNLSDANARELRVSDHPANDWEPAIACDRKGNVYVAWDTYRNGNYDIYLRRMAPEPGEPVAVAASPDFEAHASIACDREGRVWVAYDSAQANWGKDCSQAGTLRDANFTASLHAYRRLELRCVAPNGVRAAPVPIPQRLPASWRDVPEIAYGQVAHRRSYDLPHLIADANGNLWLTYRLNRQGHLGHPPGGGAWEIETMWFDGRKWSDPVFIPYSRGRNDQRVGTAMDGEGRLWFAWPTGSHAQKKDCDIYAGCLPPAPRAATIEPGAPVAV